MKRVLILTYFFSPCGLTSANRTSSWAKYFSKFGLYPVIITRNWDQEINTERDLYKQSGKKIEYQKFDNYEVYYVPYKQSRRDKILVNSREGKNIFLRKSLTFFEQLSQFLIGFSDPYQDLYNFTDKYLSENSNKIDSLIVSANPFVLFKYGSKLSKKYNLKWIADYRDDWTTTEWERPMGMLNNFIFNLERKCEKKWISSASYITSVSDFYTKNISDYTGVEGKVIINGFFHEEFENHQKVLPFKTFTITYVGSIYDDQKIEIFLDGFKAFLKSKDYDVNIKLLFAGLGFSTKQKERILDYTSEISNFIEITEWLDRREAIEIIFKSQVLLLVPAEDIKGVPASKIYEYIASNRTILLCPNDNDVMESTINEFNNCIICNSSKEIVEQLNYLWGNKSFFGMSKNIFNHEALKYSREQQAKKLVNLIKELSENE
jgi:glycosyltransferase involved in cell wall biosynthesis